jgi:hypothetical protein
MAPFFVFHRGHTLMVDRAQAAEKEIPAPDEPFFVE